MMATEALTFRQKQVSTFFGFSPFLFCFLFSAFFFFSHFYEQISNERCERFRLHICITKICFSLWVLLQYYMRYVGHFVCNVFANFNFPIWKIISLVSWCTSNKTLYGINFYRFCLFFFFFFFSDFHYSELTILRTNKEHSGNYTCVASNAQPAFVLVHIFKGKMGYRIYVETTEQTRMNEWMNDSFNCRFFFCACVWVYVCCAWLKFLFEFFCFVWGESRSPYFFSLRSFNFFFFVVCRGHCPRNDNK